MKFRHWLIATSVEEVDTHSTFHEDQRKYMSLMGFGKHAEKEIQQALATGGVQAVPTGYLRWVYTDATSRTAMEKKPEIRAELQRRGVNVDAIDREMGITPPASTCRLAYLFDRLGRRLRTCTWNYPRIHQSR